MKKNSIEDFISKIPDYPKKGILFYDISTLIHDNIAFKESIEIMKEKVDKYSFNKIAAIDARGFIFGAALALSMGIGLTIIRKSGKVPGKKIQINYELEYGHDTLEVNPNLSKNEFLLVDDLLATGGTAEAACNLISNSGGNVVCFLSLIELSFLNGKRKLHIPCESIFKYNK